MPSGNSPLTIKKSLSPANDKSPQTENVSVRRNTSLKQQGDTMQLRNRALPRNLYLFASRKAPVRVKDDAIDVIVDSVVETSQGKDVEIVLNNEAMKSYKDSKQMSPSLPEKIVESKDMSGNSPTPATSLVKRSSNSPSSSPAPKVCVTLCSPFPKHHNTLVI